MQNISDNSQLFIANNLQMRVGLLTFAPHFTHLIMSKKAKSKQHPADALLGERVEYASQPTGKPKTVIVGEVIAWEPDPARIVDQAKKVQWPAFRLQIKPEHGGRPIWTSALPNNNEPMPWPSPHDAV